AAQHTVDALHGEETVRTRGWAAIVMFLTASGFAFSLVLTANAGVRVWMAASTGYLFSIATWARWRARSEATYTRAVFRIFGYSAVAAALGVTYYVGIFSPV